MAAEDNEGFTPRGHASRFMATLDEEAGLGVLPTWALVPGSRAACMSPAGGQIQRLASRHSAEGPAGCGSMGSPPRGDSALASHRTNILSEVPQVRHLLDLCVTPFDSACVRFVSDNSMSCSYYCWRIRAPVRAHPQPCSEVDTHIFLKKREKGVYEM
jgi:hypothetical protein